MEAVYHGGLDELEARALGLDPASVLDLSASLAPLPPPPRVVEALRACDYRPYPERTYQRLREALAQRHGVPPDWVLPGNGATELIYLVCQAFLAPQGRAAVLTPAFGEYERAARLREAQVFHLPARPEEGFRWDVEELAGRLRALRPDVLFVCSPANPTGVYLGREEVERLLAALSGGLLVLDEAFVDFVDGAWDAVSLAGAGRLLLLRSLTKVFALAGVRLGYAIGRPPLLAALRAHQPPWSVNAFAVAAGVAACGCPEHVGRVRQTVREAREALARGLQAQGLTVLGGAANYLLVEVGDAPSLRRALLERGVCVRDCTSFGLPRHVRLAVPAPEQVERVLSAFAGALAARPGLHSSGEVRA